MRNQVQKYDKEAAAKVRARWPSLKRREDLSAEELREMLEYDPLTGKLRWTHDGGRYKKGDEAGADQRGYLAVYLRGRTHLLHRLVWLHVTGAWPEKQIDHINQVKSDNRWCNLRDVDPKANTENVRRPRADNRSGFIGVAKEANGKFRACTVIDGRRVTLGRYATAEEAHEVYLNAKKLHHHGFVPTPSTRP